MKKNIIIILTIFNSLYLYSQQSTSGPIPDSRIYRGETDWNKDQVIVQDVPSYLWHHGCGPTALGMVIGFYDGNGFPDLIDGNSSMQTLNVNLAIANDFHYQDYSLPLDSYPNLEYDNSTYGGAHQSDCIADFMETSWSSETNYYGWSWSLKVNVSFEEYVDYINDNYITNTSYNYFSSSSWDIYKIEIDSNRPVVLLVDSDGNGGTDHFVTGIGYNDVNNEYGIYDTWDNQIHWFQWREMSSSYPWGIYGFNILKINSGNNVEEDMNNIIHEIEYLNLKLEDGEVKIDFLVLSDKNIKIEIFDYSGRKINTLLNTKFSIGYHQIFWSLNDNHNNNVKSGIYFITLSSDKKIITKRILIY